MVRDNPYFSHGIDFSGLCHNLKNQPPEWAGGGFTKEYDLLRLEAIKQQADNIEHSALWGVQAVGCLLAVAIQTGEVDSDEIVKAGWLVKFLADIAENANEMSSNAAYAIEHGALI